MAKRGFEKRWGQRWERWLAATKSWQSADVEWAKNFVNGGHTRRCPWCGSSGSFSITNEVALESLVNLTWAEDQRDAAGVPICSVARLRRWWPLVGLTTAAKGLG